jgi:uroporphyrin-III C-methyltransferase
MSRTKRNKIIEISNSKSCNKKGSHSPLLSGERSGVRASVFLVGFGPGDPDLLTIKGLKLLKSADIIFYDDLLNQEFLLKFKADKVYVGKRKDKHSHEQDEINELLYQAALAGKKVVRLKGGDPMLFAHGGEEIEYLRSRNIKVGVVPGVTAALAASAFANIPLTHRGMASSVTFTSGHTLKNIHVPSAGTLVYYMGAANLQHIAREVIRKGWKAETPVLLVYNVSGIDQKEYFTTLQEVVDYPQTYKTPLMIIIGEVVRLRQSWFDKNIEKRDDTLNEQDNGTEKLSFHGDTKISDAIKQ